MTTFSSVLAIDDLRSRKEVLNGLSYLSDSSQISKIGPILPDLMILSDKDLNPVDFNRLINITSKLVETQTITITPEVALTISNLLKSATEEEHQLMCLNLLKLAAIHEPLSLAKREILNEIMVTSSRTLNEGKGFTRVLFVDSLF